MVSPDSQTRQPDQCRKDRTTSYHDELCDLEILQRHLANVNIIVDISRVGKAAYACFGILVIH